jgi:hypothetical protein
VIPVEWLRVEPRRLFRAEFGGRSWDLKFEATPHAPDTGWYLLTSKGKVFMARKIQDAANAASRYVQEQSQD